MHPALFIYSVTCDTQPSLEDHGIIASFLPDPINKTESREDMHKSSLIPKGEARFDVAPATFRVIGSNGPGEQWKMKRRNEHGASHNGVYFQGPT
jgi:hypothetical protein